MSTMTTSTRRAHPHGQLAELIHEIVSWEGIELDTLAGDAVRFLHGRVELGHLHGGSAAHLPFPRRIRDDLIALGHAAPHPAFPASGWIERRIGAAEDLPTVLLLFRLNYERAVSRVDLASRWRETVGDRAAALSAS